MRIVGAVIGGMLVLSVAVSMLTSLVTPRGRVGFTRRVDRVVNWVYRRVTGPMRTYEQRDSILSSQAAVSLAVMLVTWLVGFALGYGLLLWPFDHGLMRALRESASSLFTLGFAAGSGVTPNLIDFIAAASGMVAVALQIAYLPTLYGAYNRRETEVTLLGPRAGTPAWGPEILARSVLSGESQQLNDLYSAWERWSADVAESHSSYPSLLRFRSPGPHASWIIAQLALLDAAALHISACPQTAPLAARLCLRMGFIGLRRLTATLRLPVDHDPRPDDPLQLSWEDFLLGWQRVIDAGFPVERSAQDAWAHFRGWRVNYETSAYQLTYGLDAVPAAWSGPRRRGVALVRPRPFLNRTPDDPEGERSSPLRPSTTPAGRPAAPTTIGPVGPGRPSAPGDRTT